eukprot:9126049-Lingulodinium_polyedra.AAC.1
MAEIFVESPAPLRTELDRLRHCRPSGTGLAVSSFSGVLLCVIVSFAGHMATLSWTVSGTA